MGWLSLVNGMLAVVKTIAGILANRQLIDAGKAEAVADALTQAQCHIKDALDARRAVANGGGVQPSADPFNRDRG